MNMDNNGLEKVKKTGRPLTYPVQWVQGYATVQPSITTLQDDPNSFKVSRTVFFALILCSSSSLRSRLHLFISAHPLVLGETAICLHADQFAVIEEYNAVDIADGEVPIPT